MNMRKAGNYPQRKGLNQKIWKEPTLKQKVKNLHRNLTSNCQKPDRAENGEQSWPQTEGGRGGADIFQSANIYQPSPPPPLLGKQQEGEGRGKKT